MIMAIISTQKLDVTPEDFICVAIGAIGKEEGKHVYLNTRHVKENEETMFDGEGYTESLTLVQNEVKQSEDIMESLSYWMDSNCILQLNPEGVQTFTEYYHLSKDPEVISILLEEPYDDNITVGSLMVMNQLDVLMKINSGSAEGDE